MTFTHIENRIITKYITDPQLSRSLVLIRGVMEEIWAIDAPRIVQHYTDHGVAHCERLVGFVEKLLRINPGAQFSQREIYLLFAGIYLHDIGMQCDIAKYPKIKEKAEGIGAEFNMVFPTKPVNGYSLDQQKEIRKNHHFLSAAWIDYLYEVNDPVLSFAIKSIPPTLVIDLMDVCKFHSKLPIDSCPEPFQLYPNSRKRMIAALLRFADELDISETRVEFNTVKIFSIGSENNVYWWLHNHTIVDFVGSNIVYLNLTLNPQDYESYGSFLHTKYIKEFKTKNQPVLDVLYKYNIPLVVESSSDVKLDNHIEAFPEEITSALDEMIQNAQNHTENTRELVWNPLFKRNNNFIGRQDILKEISKKLVKKSKNSYSRPLLIYGDPDIGKTELVTEYVYTHNHDYDYIFWVNAITKENFFAHFKMICELLSITGIISDLESVDRVRSWLIKNKRWLLIYENANDLSLVKNSLVFNPKGDIIIVSNCKDIDTIEEFENIKVEGMKPDEAEIFILKHTNREDLTDNVEIEAIKNIAKKMNYIPSKMKYIAEYILYNNCSFYEFYSNLDSLSPDFSYLSSEKTSANMLEVIQPTPKDDIEILYEKSMYGTRIDHFRSEKELLASKVVSWIHDTYISNTCLKICLLIDSGSTTYHIFKEISSRLNHNKEERETWSKRVCIVTNNLPGSQYLLINCKKDPLKERSETAIPCFLLPGRTLSEYVAVASYETVSWVSNDNKTQTNTKSRMQDALEREWKCSNDEYKIISLISANYISYHAEDKNYKEGFWPVARGKGHFEVKEAFVSESDEVILISPLMKFSFAKVDLLNKANNFEYLQTSAEAEEYPSKVMYKEIPIDNYRCIWFTTTRNEKYIFSKFSKELVSKLQKLYPIDHVHTFDYDLGKYVNLQLNAEIDVEIPHGVLRHNYPNYNLWDKDSVKTLERSL